MGSEVLRAAPDERGVTVVAHAAAREVEHRADWLVLATGGFAEGSLTLDAHWHARETVLDLPLVHVPGPGEARFVPDYFDEQPMSRAGVAVDAGLRPVGPDGARVHERVLVAGASIGGAVPWKEHSGEGISVTTGFHAANQIVQASTSAKVAA
jgi:glycerol-3-phosphate dehydrogenase subunit B